MRITHLKQVAIVGAVSMLALGAAHAAEVARFSANGSFASVNTFDGSGFLDLGVSRNDQGPSQTTFLSFVKGTCDANGCTGIRGFGTIPHVDLAMGIGSAHLNTNLAAVPGFTVFSFVEDFVNGTFTQTPITGGVVAINWLISARNKSSRTGQESLSVGGFSVHFNGQSTSNRATATGTVLGAPVAPGGSSFVGNNKTATITIFRD
jgi:hypothetical protein